MTQIHLLWMGLLMRPVLALLSFPLDAPPSYAAHWQSIKDLRSWTHHLASEIRQLQQEKEFRSIMVEGLYDQIYKDWRKSIQRQRKWFNQKYNITLVTETEIAHDEMIWTLIQQETISVGLMVPLSERNELRGRARLLLEVNGCQRLGSIKDIYIPSSKLLSDVSDYDYLKGLKSCDKLCPESAVVMISHWLKLLKSSEGDDTALVFFSPKPLSACSAAHLFLMDVFSKQSLQKAFKALDIDPIWSDGKLALLIGNQESSCPRHVETAVTELPLSKRMDMRRLVNGQECENLISSFSPQQYKDFYSRFIAKQSDDEREDEETFLDSLPWPSAKDIIYSNAPSIKTNLLTLPCNEWNGFDFVEKTLHIPVIGAQGPTVTNIYDLVHAAFKLTAVNPTLISVNATKDKFLEKVATLCQTCQNIPGVSYKALFEVYESILNAKCKESVFGGVGLSTVERLDQIRRTPALLGKRSTQKLRRISLIGEQELNFYSPRCTGLLNLEYQVPVDREYYEDNNSIFKAKFIIDSSFFEKKDFSGTGSWSSASRKYSLIIDLGTRELQGLNPIRAQLWKDDFLRNLDHDVSLQFNLICGFYNGKRVPSFVEDRTLEAMMLSFFPLNIPNEIKVPLKYHILPVDYDHHQGLYDASILSFLSSLAVITLMRNIRQLKFSDLKYPPHLRHHISLSDPCQVGALGSFSRTRLLFRNDLVKVKACFQEPLVMHHELGMEILKKGFQISAFLIGLLKHDEKFILLDVHLRDREDVDILFHCLEYYRVNYGHQIIVSGNFHDKFIKDSQLVLEESLFKGNYEIPFSGKGLYIPFSKSTQSSNILETKINDKNICLAPSDWSKTICQDVNEYASWYRKHTVELLDDHLPARHERCSSDYFGNNVPLRFNLLNINMTVASINLEDMLYEDVLSHWNVKELRSYLNTKDIIILQNLDILIFESIKQMLKDYNKFTFYFQENISLAFIYKSSITSVGCSSEIFQGVALAGCLFKKESEKFILINVNDNSSFFPLSNPNANLDDDSIGIMKRLYVKLCMLEKQTARGCHSYPFSTIFSGSWNHDVPLKSSFSEQMKYMDFLAKQIERKNRFGDKSFSERLEVKIHIPSDIEWLDHTSDLLYPPDLKQANTLLNWISGSGDLHRQRWPLSSRIDKLQIRDWVMEWLPKERNSVLDSDSIRFDVFVDSDACKSDSKETRCLSTGPPCANLHEGVSLNGFEFKPEGVLY